jgi:hypothetical protein
MQTDDLVQQLIALPLPERVVVAQELWQSIDQALASDAADEQKDAARAALRRDAELTSGTVVGRTHQEVMEAVRRALGCA